MIRIPRPHLGLPFRRAQKAERDVELTRGQIIVLFALSLTVFIGIMGLAIDVSYTWVNEMRMQRAADAGALAGAVYLPDDPTSATNAAVAALQQNGYVAGATVTISAVQDSANREQMDVTLSAQVPTFFMRLFGINTLTPSRTAHAQFHLPVPMGSPLNVFGYPSSTDLQGNALNYWAAINGPCTLKANGDPYATLDTTPVDTNCSSVTTPDNTEYKAPSTGDPGAYDYAVKVPVAGTLTIQLYDPEFCPRSSENTDTGDTTWTSGSNFSTTFTLYNPTNTPYDLTNAVVTSTGSANPATYPGDGSTSTSDGQSGKTHSCSSYYVTGSGGSYTGKWLTFATFAAAAGTYRLNVGTNEVGTGPADGINQYAVKASLNGGSGSQPQVYAGVAGAQSAMSVFNNLASGTSYIYLAQINSTNAGKTMEVDLFDPGDVAGTGVMYFEIPTSSGWSDSPFVWRDSGTTLSASGTNSGSVTSVTTASSGNSRFNGHWLVVTITIPSNYTAPQNGWWKIKYVISGGAAHDRTTWGVEIRDSAVHLVP
jgi:hypothetical protein